MARVSLDQPLERRDEAEVVERLRAKLDGEPSDVLERLDGSRANIRERASSLVVVLRLLDRLEAEDHGREVLARLVVELEGEAAALEFLRVDGATERVARDPLGQVDGDGGPRGEELGETEVRVGEPAVRGDLVVRREDPDRLVTNKERDEERVSSSESPSDRLVDLWIVQDR